MKNPDFESMTLEDLIESQAKDDTTRQMPESRTITFKDMGVFDRYIDPDSESSVMTARNPLEARPNINGQPGVYSEIDPWFQHMRVGTHTRGCRKHGKAEWSGTVKPECLICKRERRARG